MRKNWLLCGIVMLAVNGCATTRPYQRERLADPVMSPDGDADRQALRAHMLSTREGALGGFGHGGGGCGCN
jgi:hypothetical protein